MIIYIYIYIFIIYPGDVRSRYKLMEETFANQLRTEESSILAMLVVGFQKYLNSMMEAVTS